MKEIVIKTNASESIPISDKRTVEFIRFDLFSNYDLAFLEQFTMLKRLEVHRNPASQSSIPRLPYLEELEFEIAYVVVKTRNLRELKLLNTTFNLEMVIFILQQSRLINLLIIGV